MRSRPMQFFSCIGNPCVVRLLIYSFFFHFNFDFSLFLNIFLSGGTNSSDESSSANSITTSRVEMVLETIELAVSNVKVQMSSQEAGEVINENGTTSSSVHAVEDRLGSKVLFSSELVRSIGGFSHGLSNMDNGLNSSLSVGFFVSRVNVSRASGAEVEVTTLTSSESLLELTERESLLISTSKLHELSRIEVFDSPLSDSSVEFFSSNVTIIIFVEFREDVAGIEVFMSYEGVLEFFDTLDSRKLHLDET